METNPAGGPKNPRTRSCSESDYVRIRPRKQNIDSWLNEGLFKCWVPDFKYLPESPIFAALF